MTNKLKQNLDFDDDLMERLQDDRFAIDYIFEAIAEGDEELMLQAMRNVRGSTKPEQTQEVEEGKAHVMRWVDGSKYKRTRAGMRDQVIVAGHLDGDPDNTIFYTCAEYKSRPDKFLDYGKDDYIDEKELPIEKFMTFNGVPDIPKPTFNNNGEIPMPKGEGDGV